MALRYSGVIAAIWPQRLNRQRDDDMIDFKKLFWSSLRIYFAPLVGAYNAVKAEMDRLDREHA